MGRKQSPYNVGENNRDKGKHFIITEMSAHRAESWAMRVIMALFGSNVDVPENFEEFGMAGLAQLGMKCLGQLKWDVAAPLLAEMMDCVQIIPDPKKPQLTRAIIDNDSVNDDIEEVATRINLRVEVWKLHMDFLQAVAPSLFAKAAATIAKPHPTKTSAG